MNKIEVRYIDLVEDQELQTRSFKEENGKRFIAGYAAIANSPSKKLVEKINGEYREFTETIAPTAFQDADLSSIAHLVDHNQEKIVGCTGINTLVKRTDKGLFFKTEIPEAGQATTTQEDLYRNAEQGIVKGASFAFRVAKGGDAWERRNGELFRTINFIERVVDVTSTYSPAYDSAFTFVRSLDESEIKEVVTEQQVLVETPAESVADYDLDFQISLLKNKGF